MSWNIGGVTVTDDSVRKMIRHDAKMRELSSQLSAAELEFAEAATKRLERKHRVDDLMGQIRRLAEQGPDSVEQPELPLFNDDELGGDDE
jgi:hypothetical protein